MREKLCLLVCSVQSHPLWSDLPYFLTLVPLYCTVIATSNHVNSGFYYKQGVTHLSLQRSYSLTRERSSQQMWETGHVGSKTTLFGGLDFLALQNESLLYDNEPNFVLGKEVRKGCDFSFPHL